MPTTTNIPTRHQYKTDQARDFRVGGSGFTVFHWEGQPIGFAQAFSHQSPQPVAPPVAVQPMNSRYPLEIVTPAAQGAGVIQLQLFEMYNRKVWDTIMEIVDAKHPGGFNRQPNSVYNDLVEVFVRLANIGRGINCSKIIYSPRTPGNTARYSAETYHNCKITDIRDDEDIDIARMVITKAMTIQYTHMTRSSSRRQAARKTTFPCC